jgi:xanthine dehydrogenase molybdopterin-binding subunit B
MKRILQSLMLTTLLLAFALPVAAQQYTVTTVACTNNVPNTTTTTANLGSAVTLTKYDEAAVQIDYKLNAAGTTACTFNFVTSVDGSTYGTTSAHAVVFAPNGTTLVSTNLNITIGSKGYLKLLSITAANNTADMTNIVVKVSVKPKRQG